MGGTLGADNRILFAVVGSLYYGAIALAVVRLCDVEANNTIDADHKLPPN